jgi:hypothetical protein
MRTFIATTLTGCLLQLIPLAAYIWAASWSINYITHYFGKDLHWVLDTVIGFLLGWASILIAFVLWLVS